MDGSVPYTYTRQEEKKGQNYNGTTQIYNAIIYTMKRTNEPIHKIINIHMLI